MYLVKKPTQWEIHERGRQSVAGPQDAIIAEVMRRGVKASELEMAVGEMFSRDHDCAHFGQGLSRDYGRCFLFTDHWADVVAKSRRGGGEGTQAAG